jgi:ABC-type multidrug transport system ATPase subunit
MADRMIDAVTLTDVCVQRGRVPVVRTVSFGVPQSGWFGIIGANGSGKTTLLRALAGRLPIASGRCEIAGRTLTSDRSARARQIGFAPPIDRLPDDLRVDQLLELAGESIDEQRRRCETLWLALSIHELLDRTIGECSSGMRQRVSIAIAFATPTVVVILDEPFNWLDPVAAFEARTALAEMVESGLTLITALHDLTTFCSFCTSGVVMAAGRLSLAMDCAALRAGRDSPRTFERDMIAALR